MDVESVIFEAERAISAELKDWGQGPREGSDMSLYAAAYNAGVLAALRAVNGLKLRYGAGSDEELKGERESW